MQSSRTREATKQCLHVCCLFSFLSLQEEAKKPNSDFTSTSAANRRSFATTTAASVFPNTQFNNHESLPPLQEAFAQFITAYPNYSQTHQIDEIRELEYNHLSLSNHVCLDYIGIGLFSFSQLHGQLSSAFANPSTSSLPHPLPPHSSDFPLFSLSYKSVNLKSQLLNGGHESKFESAIKKRIWDFINISEDDYSAVFTANRTSAFKLLAESYPFHSCRKLLTMYDHKSEAVEAMIGSAGKRGAHSMTAEFTWPRLRLQYAELSNMIVSGRKKSKRGLFVFQLQSRMTGARYSYQWMRMAQDHGWHVLLDACALGPKDMDSLGLSLFHPDFLICSFYKVFGENPSGFGCLFVKKSAIPILDDSAKAGTVSIVPMKKLFSFTDESSGTDTEVDQASNIEVEVEENGFASPNLLSGPLSTQIPQSSRLEQGESSEIIESERTTEMHRKLHEGVGKKRHYYIECRCLDHVDSLRLSLINSRGRYLINWLINALIKLQHPNEEKGIPLVRIYGPKVKFDRGPVLAFNVFDWKGEKVEPDLVHKLADRKNISLGCGFLQNIWFSDKYEKEKARVLEKRKCESKDDARNKEKTRDNIGIRVVTAAFGFLANFEDAYRLWSFIAQFLDADFVEKERWRYTTLNEGNVHI
ncbi:hypothetical protein Nepgr_010894 [Nepenthes gracilis]|uniref:Molybdenum cofactor sulfurase n=1 Tax=Nepenthes gracilis TaxID=150966 RepID=A0AAD3SDU0_NEPGR|nr:hypothetical protein Nepgr_010894 [Nepenthes gracilis]